MRILLIHNYYQIPGGENAVFQNLCRLLQRVGQEVEIYSRNNLEILNFNIKDKVLMGLGSFFSLRTWREVRSLVQRKRPHVAIVQNVFPLISPSVYYVLKSEGIPIIQAVYNYRFVCSNAHLFTQGQICERCIRGNYWHSVVRKCYKQSRIMSSWYAAILQVHRLVHTFSRNIDIFMVPDDFMATRLILGGIPTEKIRKNVNPFFVEDYQPSYEQGKFILYVGRLVKQKGIFTLVEAMAQVSLPSPPLYIVGDGEERKELELMVTRLGLQNRIKILGAKWGSEVQQLIRESMFIVIPSEWYDNLPLILCQAYAMAKPVVASYINGIPEYVENGVDGLLFQPGNAQELARCIEQLISNPSLLAKMSVRARRKAEEVFDFQAYWNKLAAIIQEVAL
jgi:glycosyltransferase involved in cell wall biosynthesis